MTPFFSYSVCAGLALSILQVLLDGHGRREILTEDNTIHNGGGLYLFTVMPFRFCNSPATSKRLACGMHVVWLWEVCLLYLGTFHSHKVLQS